MRVLPLLVLLALGGCTHGRAVRSSADVAAFNRRVEERRVVVVLADGRRQPADGLRAEGDSLSWIDPATRLVGRAATADLRGVTVEDAALGAIVGTVAFYDWVCQPGSWSRRRGLCSR